MKKNLQKAVKTALILESCLLLASPVFALTSKNPEQETAEIAKNLHPIPDDEWKEIAGDRAEEAYTVVQGDTLYDLSERLFGDSKYWPKIWAINNGGITNPHYILPGKTVAFLPGTGTSLPSLGEDNADSDNENATASKTDLDEDKTTEAELSPGRKIIASKKSQEWKRLPRQEWEEISIRLPPEVDPDGFDRRSRVQIVTNTKYDLPFIGATKKIPPLGRIIASENETDTITLQDIVFISSKDCSTPVQVGGRYAVADVPYLLKEKPAKGDKKTPDPRTGYSYAIAGTIKILSEKNGLYTGIVEEARIPFYRGSMLLPLPPRISGELHPVAASAPIVGTMMLDPYFSTSTVAQHKFVFVDRGTDDGVQDGMIFRAYQHKDLNNDLLITKNNVLISADLEVVQTSEKFSVAYIIHSDNYISAGEQLTALTDVSDLLKVNRFRRRLENLNGLNAADELDQLDNGQGISEDEKRELKQLERYQGEASIAPPTAPVPDNGEVPPPPPSDSAAAPPSDVAPPPPLPDVPSPAQGTPSQQAVEPPSPGTQAPEKAPPPTNNNDEEDIPPPPAS